MVSCSLRTGSEATVRVCCPLSSVRLFRWARAHACGCAFFCRIVQTLFAWFFILVIAFRFIPTSVISRPVSAVWMPLVQEPWYRLPYKIRITVGWFCLLAIVFGSAFGFKLTGVRGDFILFLVLVHTFG